MAGITVTAQITDVLSRYRDLTRTQALAYLQEFFDEESRVLRFSNDSEDIALVANQRAYSFSASGAVILRIWDFGLVYDASSADALEATSARRLEIGLQIPRQQTGGTPTKLYQEFSGSGSKQLALDPPPDTSSLVITSATNATPVVITTTTTHGLSDGDAVYVQGVAGNTAANGSFYAKVTGYSTTTFGLYSDSTLATAVAGSGAYTSGGVIGTLAKPFLRVWLTRRVTLGEASNTTALPDSILSMEYLSSGVWARHARRRHPGDLAEHLQLLARQRALMRQSLASLIANVPAPRWEPRTRRLAAARPL